MLVATGVNRILPILCRDEVWAAHDKFSSAREGLLPLHLATEGTRVTRPGALPPSRKCQTPMSAIRGNPEDICSQ
jgi:hypothetical protein